MDLIRLLALCCESSRKIKKLAKKIKMRYTAVLYGSGYVKRKGMSDLFEEDEEVIEVIDDFDKEDVDEEILEVPTQGLDARRRLENMLDEKRLRDELDDFTDY